MTLSYDQAAKVLEIDLERPGIFSRTVEVDAGTLVDVDEFGNALVTEVIHPARQWPLDEVIEKFAVDVADAAMLRAMWPRAEGEARYPFGQELQLA